MSPELVELSRQIANVIRLGTVVEVYHAIARCRVQSGGVLTTWLPWFSTRAGTTRDWDPPTVGEQVMLFAPSGELAAAVVLTGIYSGANAAPDISPTLHRRIYPDGAIIDYDHASHHLDVSGIATASVHASVSITLDTPYTHVTGAMEVDGLLTYHDGIAGEGGGHGNHISGSFNIVGGDVTADSINLKTHVHSGVQTGGGNTGAPV